MSEPKQPTASAGKRLAMNAMVGQVKVTGGAAAAIALVATYVVAGVFGLGLGGTFAMHQAHACNAPQWLQNIKGYDANCGPDRSAAIKRRQAKRNRGPLQDLRPGKMPLRSLAMLDAVDAAIVRYQKIAAQGGWNTIPKGRYLRPGDDDERAPALRRRLIRGGDLDQRFWSRSFSYGRRLEAAVRRFQKRHGLITNGVVDARTLAHLNIPAATRLAQLRVNRARIRDYLAQPTDQRYIFVNVPAFQLEAVEGYEVQRRHRVIVGKPDRQTPTLKATIKGLNFFPYWRVPDSVAHKDLIPRLRREPDYLQNEHIRVLTAFGGQEVDPRSIDWSSPDAKRYKFRQDPGKWNALGLVRINMPNDDIIYLHDTPMQRLFSQRSRAYSAGCVRVHDVMELVKWLARYEPGWQDGARVDEVLASGIGEDLKFTRPVPVYLAYITAWVEEDGEVQFRYDMYGRDGIPELTRYRPPEDAPPPGQKLTP
ncbi:MAG: L,D-transpeptidase family protein [Pseudomonadota bacterium]